MKKASIITVGSEIMSGLIQDTNFTFLARFLKDIGIPTIKRVSTNDKIEDIVYALQYVNDTDIVFIIGGLGPTDDDISREALAKFLDKELIFNENQWQKIVEFFKNKEKPIFESNKKQAELINGAIFIENNNGTAPGMFYKNKNRIYFLLPGPPKENIPMIKESVYNILKENNFITGDITSRIFRLYNIGESEIADIVKNIDNKDINIGYYWTPKGYVEIHLNKFYDYNQKKDDFKQLEDEYIKIFEKNKIFWTEDFDLSYIVYKELKSRNLTISFAESITGGNISGNFVLNPGVSSVFKGSIVCYSNESKIELLKIKNQTLIKFGAVSEEVAKKMVLGLKKIFNTDICVSVTGIAGPTGETEEKKIGLVYFGFLINNNLFIKKENFLGDRERIINKAVNYVFMEIIKNIT